MYVRRGRSPTCERRRKVVRAPRPGLVSEIQYGMRENDRSWRQAKEEEVRRLTEEARS